MTHKPFDPIEVRHLFPALKREVNGHEAVYFDGPGGTQVPQPVIDAMRGFLGRGGSNLGGPFVTSRETDTELTAARQAMADMLNAASPNEIVFGQNMTSLTFHISRAISREWQAGDEIIVTNIDHSANISPWVQAAEDRGVTVHHLDFDPTDCTLQLEKLPALLNDRTRLLAIAYASNAVGSITDVQRAINMAQAAGAMVFVDAVHYAPHGLIDVQALGCDFLACSVYKFFGPHTGVLYGKYELLDRLKAYKVRPASNTPPDKWETGTQSFESLVAVRATVDYLADLGTGETRRDKIISAHQRLTTYEEAMSRYFLEKIIEVPGVRVFGITDVERLNERTPTFAISLASHTPAQIAEALGDQGIFVWDGHYYAMAVMETLGLLDKGGLVRIGFAHYNTFAEIDRLLAALHQLAQG